MVRFFFRRRVGPQHHRGLRRHRRGLPGLPPILHETIIEFMFAALSGFLLFGVYHLYNIRHWLVVFPILFVAGGLIFGVYGVRLQAPELIVKVRQRLTQNADPTATQSPVEYFRRSRHLDKNKPRLKSVDDGIQFSSFRRSTQDNATEDPLSLDDLQPEIRDAEPELGLQEELAKQLDSI